MLIPVIALTGHLGAGKTTVLNHLLSRPGSRVGVIVNDFGAINVDAALITGQVDEAASIAGGCICCLPDTGGLDDALRRLTDPRLRLDAVIVEASGAAEPLAVARLIRFSGAERARLGGVIDVVDAARHFGTVDIGGLAPARHAAATLVVVNKLDAVAPAERDALLARLTARVRERNAGVPVIATSRGRIDPALVFDIARDEDPQDQLPLAASARAGRTDDDGGHHIGHQHAAAVTVLSDDPVDAGALLDLLEDPPPGAYRIKGCVLVRTARGRRRHLVDLVGRSIHVSLAPASASALPNGLVAIGLGLDEHLARERLGAALAPRRAATAAGWRRLERYRLSR